MKGFADTAMNGDGRDGGVVDGIGVGVWKVGGNEVEVGKVDGIGVGAGKVVDSRVKFG